MSSLRAALAARGLPPAVEVGWEQVVRAARTETMQDRGALAALAALASCDRVRIDSFGENAAVHEALIELGGAPHGTRLEFGELAYLKQAHAGWLELLGALEQLPVQRAAWLSQPADVAVMFDKWLSHERFAAAELPRPAAWLVPSSTEEFLGSLPERGQWFLKPLYGSSASGVCALRFHGEKLELTAPIELAFVTPPGRDSSFVAPPGREVAASGAEVKLFNSLRVRRFAQLDQIKAILNVLLPHGMLGEEWLPKARLDGLEFDLRIVVIAGEARHVVVRQSRHPMTNLHLGNTRGELSRLVDVFGAGCIAACTELAERAMACFPETLYAGVDVLLGRDQAPRVLEINAFGDLLPGVLHRGEGTAEAIVSAALRGH